MEETITLNQQPCPVYVPNVFQRGSVNNGTFKISPHPDFSGLISNLTIYDRWGSVVYQSADPESILRGWDGRNYKEQKINTGLFVYSVEIIYPDGSSTYLNGTVTVL
ncbi:MAG: hypothetical protein HKN76_04850 [Saprospiraceae bacterium]|nr:hypothetical protein [Saprospiraceae bacterium]